MGADQRPSSRRSIARLPPQFGSRLNLNDVIYLRLLLFVVVMWFGRIFFFTESHLADYWLERLTLIVLILTVINVFQMFKRRPPS